MTTYCQPMLQSVANGMLELVARALCDRPGDKAVQREARARQMIHSTMGFEPRDGLEYMLSTMVYGHFHLILDAMHDAMLGQMDEIKTKTKMSIVSLDKSMLAFVREIRHARGRPLAPWAAAEQVRAQDSVQTPANRDDEMRKWAAEWAQVPPAEPVAEQPAVTETETSAAVTAEPAPIAGTACEPGSVPLSSPEAEEATVAEHMAAFQEAFAAVAETLAEARAYDEAQKKTAKPNGD